MTQDGGSTRRFLGLEVSPSGLLGLGLLGVNLLVWIALGVVYFTARERIGVIIVLAGATIPLQLVLLATLSPLRAVIRQTFSQVIRAKILAAGAVLLVAAMVLIRTQMVGDGTLTGQVRTLLSYGTAVIGFVLSAVTIVVSASLISEDVRKKTVFTVATKPLPRWQYVLGRWMGLVLVNAVLIVPAMVFIYAQAQYVRFQDKVGPVVVEPGDRLATETEVFTARTIIRPKPLDVEAALKERVEALRKDPDRIENIIKEYREQRKCDRQTALAGIEEDLRKQILSGGQTAGPLPPDADRDSFESVLRFGTVAQTLHWKFSGIELAGARTRGEGTVSAKPMEDRNRNLLRVQIRSTPQLIARLAYRGPVKVNSLDGYVQAVGRDVFWAVFLIANDVQRELAALQEGAKVNLTVEPTLQVVFKGQALEGKDEDVIHGVWLAINPTTNMRSQAWRDDPGKVQATWSVPASVVDDQGNMDLVFINRSIGSVTIMQDDVGVMYPVSSFELNMVKSSVLILLQVAFLAAIGLFFSSFLSYPVACLVTLMMLPLTLARGFIGEALAPAGQEADFFMVLGNMVLQVTNVLLPDLTSTSPSDGLLGGVAFSWLYLGQTAYLQIAVRTLMVLIAACAIYQRRELAQVQV
jgi:hypothetical protein